MDLTTIQSSIVTKVYHIKPEMKVPLHKHDGKDEIFYCIKGSGFGVLQDKEVDLEVGKAFIVRSGIMHSLRTNKNMFVCSFLIPVVDQTLK
jgi:mannose-6-phosphate isomerase-like protein (cupin superfamily)